MPELKRSLRSRAAQREGGVLAGAKNERFGVCRTVPRFAGQAAGTGNEARGRGREVTRRRVRDVMSAAIEHDVTVVAIGLPLPPTSSARRLCRRAAPRAHTPCGCTSLHRRNMTCLSLAHPARLDCDRPHPSTTSRPGAEGFPPPLLAQRCSTTLLKNPNTTARRLPINRDLIISVRPLDGVISGVQPDARVPPHAMRSAHPHGHPHIFTPAPM